jgi:hypothetical protein
MVSVVTALALAGCGDHAAPTGGAASTGPTWIVRESSAPGGGPATAPSADDPPGAITCAKLAAAISAVTIMDPGVVDGIVTASNTADAPVADAAQRLASAYAAAVAAKGSDDEPDAVAGVSAAAADMSGVCDDSGLETVG